MAQCKYERSKDGPPSVSAAQLALLPRGLTLVCLWFGWQVNQANQRRKAVAWIQQMGRIAVYDYHFDDDGNYNPDGKPKGPKWLQDYYNRFLAQFSG
ncbi:MAG: hypothetical protein CMJ64_11445 [Planctomycetaceae bacterium]|nr:hypothetical protein [Planctomycetaceae bacterium]